MKIKTSFRQDFEQVESEQIQIEMPSGEYLNIYEEHGQLVFRASHFDKRIVLIPSAANSFNVAFVDRSSL